MKRCLSILMVFVCLACAAADKSSPGVSKKDRKAAEEEFQKALELQKAGRADDALLAATRATLFDPGSVQFVTLREVLKQQIVGEYLERGNRLADEGNKDAAAAQFREGLARDPKNSYLQQRLRDVSPLGDPEHQRVVQMLASVNNIDIAPLPGRKNIHVAGDTRRVYTQIGKAFGIEFQFDNTLSTRSLRIDLDRVDFFEVTAFLGKISKTFWAPVTAKDAIVANDNQEMRTAYERLSVRTFYISNATSANELNDVANVLRTIFEFRFVSVEPSKNTITVRGQRARVEAAASLLDSLMDARPEILLEVNEYEFDTNNLSQFGLNLPTDFQIFSIPSEIRRVLGSDAQQVIDQLNQTGTIDPSKISPTALANLQNSPLLLPFVFFGKGQGLTGIVVPGVSGRLSANRSFSITTEHATLRSTDGEPAMFRVGNRFPVVTANFTAISLNSRGQLQSGTTPQFTFVDLGLTLKATPHYHSDGNIKLDMELEIQGLGAQSVNNIPELTDRSFKGNITVRDGEPSVVLGLVTDQELRSTKGFPLLGQIPGLQSVLNSNSRDRAHNEILVVVTPRVVRKPFRDKGASTFWNVN